MTISLAGNVLQHVEVEPNSRIYLKGIYGENVEKELTVYSNDKKAELEILEVSSNIDDKITYQVVPTGEPGRYQIKLWKNPKLPTLNTWGSLFIKTNHEEAAEKVIQVNVTTRGSIVVQPSNINFGAVQFKDDNSSTAVERAMTVFKIKGGFEIQGIDFSSSAYSAEVVPVEDGKKYKVTVSFNPEVRQKTYMDEMIIRTNDPQEPQLQVRLMARGP